MFTYEDEDEERESMLAVGNCLNPPEQEKTKTGKSVANQIYYLDK